MPPVNRHNGQRQLIWTKWLELCFEKAVRCFYGESWKKREFLQWNDCKGLLATWVRRCLSLSHPLLLPHHLSNGSSFRLPSVTTVHKQVGGAKKRFGNGKCGRASHSASISSLSSSLFGTFATLRHTWHFFFELWLSWCCIMTLSFLRVGVRVHPLSVLLKASYASNTDWDMKYVCTSIRDWRNPFFYIPFLNLFIFILKR